MSTVKDARTGPNFSELVGRDIFGIPDLFKDVEMKDLNIQSSRVNLICFFIFPMYSANQIAGLSQQNLQRELIHVFVFCYGNKYPKKEESEINILVGCGQPCQILS